MLSIIIPSRVDEFLQKTIDILLQKAEEEVEIIVVLDGYWPNPTIKDDPRVRVVHQGTQFDNKGMRAGINVGMALARGKYVMKIDEHCNVDQGYDRKLKEDCADNWVVIPRRYRLNYETFENLEDGRPPIDYMHIDYPFQRPNDRTCGLHGAEWKRPERNNILIDRTPSMQGSCYFTTKKWWDTIIGPLDDVNYGTFTQEAQEIGMKTWFSGGEVIVNKKTWYSHLHKGKLGKGYGFSNQQYKKHGESMNKGRIFCRDYWLNTKDYKYDWDWFMTLFPDMPGWGNDWKEKIDRDKAVEVEKLEIN